MSQTLPRFLGALPLAVAVALALICRDPRDTAAREARVRGTAPRGR
ncbi:MAG: hypothetical protein P8Y27_12710 [Chromatiaceae bacterium]